MRRQKRWKLYPENSQLAGEISARHGLPRLLACVLLNRGLHGAEEIRAFLDPTLERLYPPFGLADMEAAAARLGRAVRRGEPVAVYGDYDADGLTATSLLRQFFRELGLTCIPFVPDRLRDGYGLKVGPLQELASQARLLVTVDCGISDYQEVAWAREQGLEVIVTDHHEIPPELPPALAVVNPKRGGGEYPFEELAGVGVALLLALAVRAELRAEGWFTGRREPNLKSYLDLVALGTAADVVPVLGENRILVHQGLKVLEETRRPGLIALKEAAGLEGKPISFRDLVFKLAPRINAAGRMGQARCALEILLSEDLAQARAQANYLQTLNRQRQALEEEVLKEAGVMVRKAGMDRRPVMVLAGEGWHPGVLGIVAARLAEEYHRPAALVSLKDGVGRGSARSIEGFHLFKGLAACHAVLRKYGGHQAAAGFEVLAENLAALQDRLEQAFLEQLGPEPPKPTLKVHAPAALPDFTPRFFETLNRLRPFGPGNPEPVFALSGVECGDSWVVNGRHLKVKFPQTGLEAIAFDMARHHPLGGVMDLAVSTRLSHYQGRALPDLRLLDWGRP